MPLIESRMTPRCFEVFSMTCLQPVLRFSLLVIGAYALVAPAVSSAQVAKVLRSDGVAMLERSGQPRRILGVGEELAQKDIVSVGGDSSTMLEFRDQTRITLRPNTVFRLDTYLDGKSESMLFGLVKGGFRAVTGLIAKRSPGSVQFQTATATIGIRGTEFDARLCEGDCATEDRAQPPARKGLEVVARIVDIGGAAGAGPAGRPSRLLTSGAQVHEGETIATAAGSYTVIAFSDGSRVTLPADTVLTIEQFRYDAARPEQSAVALRLSEGGLRVSAGEIAQRNPAGYRIQTELGRVQVRGTLVDMVCTGECAGGNRTAREDVALLKSQADRLAAQANAEADKVSASKAPSAAAPTAAAVVPAPQAGLTVYARDGSAVLETEGDKIEAQATQTLVIASRGSKAATLSAPPSYIREITVPRPDTVLVDSSLFGQPAAQDYEPGLYVWVRDGTVRLDQSAGARLTSAPRFIRTAAAVPQAIDITAGQAAVATRERVIPLPAIPNFMRFDPTPLPQRASIGYVLPAFRAPDRSISNTCAP